jgi:tetrahydromethanopterin S-methyltransferase subunit D
MKDLDPLVFWAVFREMLGPWLYVILAVALVATVLFVRALFQEHGLNARRFVWSQAAGLVGGLGALLFMWAITSSSIRDVGGPIDALMVIGIYLAGWAGATMLFYAVAGLARPPHQPA